MIYCKRCTSRRMKNATKLGLMGRGMTVVCDNAVKTQKNS